MCKFIGLCIVLLLCFVACSPPGFVAVSRFDYSDREFKKSLDALYKPASTLHEIENAIGAAPFHFSRAQITGGGDLELQEAMRRVDALGPKKVDVVVFYISKITSATWSRDVLLFDDAGKLLWSYRLRLG
jgi:hypothetical protein